MNDILKKFILDHSEDIDNNNWSKLYRLLIMTENSWHNISEFTKLLLHTNIDPLPYMSKIPHIMLLEILSNQLLFQIT